MAPTLGQSIPNLRRQESKQDRKTSSKGRFLRRRLHVRNIPTVSNAGFPVFVLPTGARSDLR